MIWKDSLTVCVTGAGAGVDSVWEQEKLEARKMLENGDESPASSARCVGQRYYIPLFSPQEFIWRWLLEKLNPWIHHLDRYVEGLL